MHRFSLVRHDLIPVMIPADAPFRRSIATCRPFVSGRQDLNLRPPGPQPDGSGTRGCRSASLRALSASQFDGCARLDPGFDPSSALRSGTPPGPQPDGPLLEVLFGSTGPFSVSLSCAELRSHSTPRWTPSPGPRSRLGAGRKADGTSTAPRAEAAWFRSLARGPTLYERSTTPIGPLSGLVSPLEPVTQSTGPR